MANTKVLDNTTIMITSSIKKEDLLDVQKYNPTALALYDEKENPIFAIGFGAKGGISEFGIVYSGVNAEGYATAIMLFAQPVEDRRKWVIDELGVPLSKLEELEAKLPEAVAKIAENKACVGETVTMA